MPLHLGWEGNSDINFAFVNYARHNVNGIHQSNMNNMDIFQTSRRGEMT